MGLSTCKNCLTTTYADETGFSTCKNCPKGYWNGEIYAKQYNYRCTDVSGQKVISTYAKCEQARERLQIGGSSTVSGSWSWLPQGCSMWGSRLHYNSYGHLRACYYSSSKYCICDNSANSPTGVTNGIYSSCSACVTGKYQDYNKQTTCKQC